ECEPRQEIPGEDEHRLQGPDEEYGDCYLDTIRNSPAPPAIQHVTGNEGNQRHDGTAGEYIDQMIGAELVTAQIFIYIYRIKRHHAVHPVHEEYREECDGQDEFYAAFFSFQF